MSSVGSKIELSGSWARRAPQMCDEVVASLSQRSSQRLAHDDGIEEASDQCRELPNERAGVPERVAEVKRLRCQVQKQETADEPTPR